MQEPARAAVIVISSQVARGGVGLRAAGFALERLGYPVWMVPSVVLPFHPGHGAAHRIVPEREAFAALIDDLIASPWLGEVGAVLSGYLGEAAQAGPIARLVEAVKVANPSALYACDPVIGDEGGLYVPEATAVAIRDMLVPLAELATPNRFELAWLAGRALKDNAALVEAAKDLAPPQVLVSSAHALMRGHMATLLVGAGAPMIAEHPAVANAPHGPGDLLAALFLANRLDGAEAETALKRATAAVFELVAQSNKRGADELVLAAEQGRLARPMAMVTVRRLAMRREV